MREIEVKYRVEDLETLLIALKARGIEVSEPVYQDDQAYAPTGWQRRPAGQRANGPLTRESPSEARASSANDL